ncbi:winged helix-turn-helix domain-containing protein [Vibrio rarus]|uniref:winged helix-turn-helix domain-containing protein n=1 Tax=Vibrio rarus TaxID=413403 RepID=UPI0021C3F1AF|nr:winged helix-turn-helix domain-containing protein [Vibrio rarus]
MSPLSLEPPIYTLGELRFSPLSGVLEVSGEKVVLRAREASLLNALIESFPEVLTRTEIEAQLWANSYATNATINQTIKSLRFSLKDEERTIIRTIPKQGYLLSKKPLIEESMTTPSSAAAPLVTVPEKIEPNQHRVYLYVATAASIIAFTLGGIGIGQPATPRISQKIDSAWYLMAEIPNAVQSQISAEYNNREVVVMHSGTDYTVCQLDTEVMQCKKL